MSALFIFQRIGVLRIHDNSSDNRNFLLDDSRLEQLKLLGDIHHLCERAKVPLQRIVEAHLRGGDNLGNATEPLRILDTDGLEKGVAQQPGVVLPSLGATFWVSGLALFEARLYVFSDFISHFRVSSPQRRGGLLLRRSAISSKVVGAVEARQLSAVALPASYGGINVLRVDFDAVPTTTGFLCSD